MNIDKIGRKEQDDAYNGANHRNGAVQDDADKKGHCRHVLLDQ